MNLSNLYIACADKLRTKGYLPDSRESTLQMCKADLVGIALDDEKALLNQFLLHIEKKIDRFSKPAYKMSPAMRINFNRASEHQGNMIGVGGW